MMTQLSAGQNRPWPNRTYAWFVVVMLSMIYLFSFIDRTIIALLVEPIKADLKITDTQFGLLYGLAFSLFYTTLGIPIGVLADNHSRRNIITIGVTLWGIATAACGFATSFIQLFLNRMLVGVGEATLSPSATSMISDYFPPEERTKALGIYSLGLFLGTGLAVMLGGYVIEYISNAGPVPYPLLSEMKPWQLAFVIVGIPGPIIAVLFYFSVREPARRELGKKGVEDKSKLSDFLAYLKDNKSPFLNHYIGYAFLVLYAYSNTAWGPAFYGRTFDLSTGEIGLYFGGALLAGSILGSPAGAWFASHRQKNGVVDINMRIGIYSALGIMVAGTAFPFMPTLPLSIAMMVATQFFITFPFGAAPAALFDISENRFRAKAAAFYYLSINLIGLSLGPLLVGLMTDYVFADEAAVGKSLVILAIASSALSIVLLSTGLSSFRNLARQMQAERAA